MSEQSERFWYPFTATTVMARKLVPLLLFSMGVGLLVWAGRELYFWQRPWAVIPEVVLAVLCWVAAAYFWTLLPEIQAHDAGLRVRRWGLLWRQIPWDAVAGVQQTAQINLMGWEESFYTVYAWRAGRGRRSQREGQRIKVRAFRFSGHIQNCGRLLTLIQARSAATPLGASEPTS